MLPRFSLASTEPEVELDRSEGWSLGKSEGELW
jgi:hypothetical protein